MADNRRQLANKLANSRRLEDDPDVGITPLSANYKDTIDRTVTGLAQRPQALWTRPTRTGVEGVLDAGPSRPNPEAIAERNERSLRFLTALGLVNNGIMAAGGAGARPSAPRQVVAGMVKKAQTPQDQKLHDYTREKFPRQWAYMNKPEDELRAQGKVGVVDLRVADPKRSQEMERRGAGETTGTDPYGQQTTINIRPDVFERALQGTSRTQTEKVFDKTTVPHGIGHWLGANPKDVGIENGVPVTRPNYQMTLPKEARNPENQGRIDALYNRMRRMLSGDISNPRTAPERLGLFMKRYPEALSVQEAHNQRAAENQARMAGELRREEIGGDLTKDQKDAIRQLREMDSPKGIAARIRGKVRGQQ